MLNVKTKNKSNIFVNVIHHDIAPAYFFISAAKFGSENITVVPHPPYWPDWSLVIFPCFRK